MNTKMVGWVTGLTVALAVGFAAPATAAKEGFTLVGAVPDDVFLCIAGKHNPERKFLDDYWDEVFDALEQTGIGSDIMELIGSFLGEEQRAEVDRLKEWASQLLDGVDWEKLGGGQMVFAERMAAPMRIGKNLTMGPPDMVWLIRGAKGSASKNYDGLVAILQAIVAKVNKAAGKEALSMATAPREGAKVASVNLLGMVPQAPPFSLAVALHGEVIVIAVGDSILDEVLGLLTGKGSKKPLTAGTRFKRAFAGLPDAEDEMTFFDMQAMLGTIRKFVEEAVAENLRSKPKDAITNAYTNEKANELANKGVEAYQRKDYKQALEYTKQALEAAPTDSRVMYNLACFNAVAGNKNEALSWLEKAVDGGFNAPGQISHDSDLKTLRDHPRYEAALAKAAKHVAGVAAGKPSADAAKWKQLIERLTDVPGMIDYVASVQYTKEYAIYGEELAALVPGAKDKPFYPVFGNRKPLTNFDRYLPKETVSFSVNDGIDLGALYKFIEETMRGMGSEGDEILANWARLQEQFGVDAQKDILGWIHGELIEITMKQPLGDTWVLMLKVTDEVAAREKLASALGFLSTNLQQMAQQQPMLAMLAIRTEPASHEKLSGFHNVTIGMQPQPAVCGVTDGYLIVGSSADAVALCLATAAGEHPNIRENGQVMAEALIPKGPFRSISFTDKRNLGAKLAQGAGVVSMIGGMATMAIPNPEAQRAATKILGMVAKLGPVAQKIDFYKSSTEYTTFDGKTWHTRSVTNYRAPAKPAADEDI